VGQTPKPRSVKLVVLLASVAAAVIIVVLPLTIGLLGVICLGPDPAEGIVQSRRRSSSSCRIQAPGLVLPLHLSQFLRGCSIVINEALVYELCVVLRVQGVGVLGILILVVVRLRVNFLSEKRGNIEAAKQEALTEAGQVNEE